MGILEEINQAVEKNQNTLEEITQNVVKVGSESSDNLKLYVSIEKLEKKQNDMKEEIITVLQRHHGEMMEKTERELAHFGKMIKHSLEGISRMQEKSLHEIKELGGRLEDVQEATHRVSHHFSK